MSKTAAELAELVPVPKKKKFEKVSSSGYGVVNPVPSIPAKVTEVRALVLQPI